MIADTSESFPVTIDLAEDGICTVVRVANSATAEVREAYLTPEEFAGQDWNTIVSQEAKRLRSELGYVESPRYSVEEFVSEYFLTQNENDERDTVLVIKHQSTGRTSPGISGKTHPGSSFLVARNEAFERLIQELREAGVEPQPVHEGIKRLGKQRGKSADRV